MFALVNLLGGFWLFSLVVLTGKRDGKFMNPWAVNSITLNHRIPLGLSRIVLCLAASFMLMIGLYAKR